MTNERDWFSGDVSAAGLPPIEDTYSDEELWFGALPFKLMLSTGTHATVSRAATGSSNFAEASLKPTESSKDVSSSSEGTC
jgi:hypothetical protein